MPIDTPDPERARWREEWADGLHAPEDLVRFVDAMGCCTRIELPRYSAFPAQSAVMGALAPGAPDSWFWKDDLHVERRIYYTYAFGGHPGYLSYALLPALIATNGEVADELIYRGALSAEALQVYRVIEAHGPVPKRTLKTLLPPEVRRSASRLLIELERRFIITKTAITGRTLGTYGYVWDLVERWAPEQLQAADRLGRVRAQAILRDHLAAFGIAPDSAFYAKVLGWTG